MRLFAPGFLLGVCAVFYFPKLPEVYYAAITFLLCLFFFYKNRWGYAKFLLAISAGFLWALIYIHLFVAKPLPHQLESKKLKVTGVILSIPQQKQHYASFMFKIKKPAKRIVRLSWYGWRDLKPGQTWQLLVKLKRPRGLSNPGGFDFAAWAMQQRMTATGYVVKSHMNQLKSSHWYHATINQFRYDLLRKLKRVMHHSSMFGFIAALTLGDRQGITQQDWQVFQRTGTSHLVAISGLHIGLVATLVFFLLKQLWRLWPRLLLRLSAQQFAAIGALFAALIYSAMAGFALPTQRALIMLSVVFVSLVLKRHIAPWHALCTALFLVLLIDPLAVLSISFWLSFCAVAVIIYAVSSRLKQANKYIETARLQIIVVLGLVPLSLWFFGVTSLFAPFANLIAIPWVGIIVVPLSLLACAVVFISPWLAGKIMSFAALNMQGVWWCLSHMANQEIAAVHYTIPSLLSLILFLIAILLLIAPKGFPAKYLAIFLCLPIIFVQKTALPADSFKFTMLDVGQGLASVIQTRHHVLIYDAGPAYEGAFNAAKSVVLPFLQSEGVRKIDTLVISHPDNDHAGGARFLLNHFHIKQYYTSNHAADSIRCHAGQSWRWDGVQFQMLGPSKVSKGSRNNQSCVLKVSVGKDSLLLPGDIESAAEHTLLKNEKSLLPSTILVAPHHGSKTSSSIAFVKAVHPEYVLFPAGYLNRFHFPNKNVVKRYRSIGAKTYTSSQSGAMTFYVQKDFSVRLPIQNRIINKKWWR